MSTAQGHQSAYALAVDGGQSSTTCLVGQLDGTALGLGIGGPIWHIGERGGRRRLERGVGAAVRRALSEAGLSARGPRVAGAYLSLTGSSGEALELVRSMLPLERVVADSDAIGALASGRYGQPGIGLVAGTGACAVAIGPGGERIIRGGWGCVLGDEGGGYWIGLAGLRAAVRACDGRGARTRLAEDIAERLMLTDLREAFGQVATQQLDRVGIAALAPLVMISATAGDAVAEHILDEAARELGALAEATATAATFLRGDERVLVATGGVLQLGNPLWRRFATVAAERLPDYQVVRPHLPQVAGAYLLALGLAGSEVTEDTVTRLQSSLGGLRNDASKAVAIE